MKYFWSYWKIFHIESLLWKHGWLSINIDVCYTCPLQCEYCKAELAGKGTPKVLTKKPDEWIAWLTRFPAKNIQQVVISGGEPSIYKGLHVLINWLLEQRIMVTLATNLWNPDEILKIKQSRRLEIWASYHETDNLLRFDDAYKKLIPYYQISVREYKTKLLPYSQTFEVFENLLHWGCNIQEFCVSPDHRIYPSCNEHYSDRYKRLGGVELKPISNEDIKDTNGCPFRTVIKTDFLRKTKFLCLQKRGTLRKQLECSGIESASCPLNKQSQGGIQSGTR